VIDTTEILCSNFFATGLEIHRMRIAVMFAVSALLVAQNGRAEAADPCISKATEALPRISGLVVKKSRRALYRRRFYRHGKANRSRSSSTSISRQPVKPKPIPTCVS